MTHTTTTWLRSALLAAAVVLSGTGCGALDRVDAALASTGAFDLPTGGDVDDGCAVTVDAGFSRGRGLVIGPHTVLTVAHVVDHADGPIEVTTSALAFTPARISGRIAAEPEDIVVLELATSPGALGFAGFGADRVRSLGSGTPAYVLTQRGPRSTTARLEHGDSGSPVVDASGAAVALVVGRTADGGPVFASLRGQPGPLAPGLVTTLAARR